MGLAMCSREAFLQMKEFGLEGHIIHINSISGHEKISGSDPLWFNMHSPAQNAVTCITEIMRKEITHGKYPVKVTVRIEATLIIMSTIRHYGRGKGLMNIYFLEHQSWSSEHRADKWSQHNAGERLWKSANAASRRCQ